MPRPRIRNPGLKLLALGLAVLIWFRVADEPVIERGVEAPLGFENVPDDLLVTGGLPESVHVRVRGPASIVYGLGSGDVVAVVDLAGERPGRRRIFDMLAGRVRAPFQVEVLQVVPATITASLEGAGEPRTVAVVPAIEGRPADGFAVGRIATVPASVEVIGPESRLAELTEALTEPVSIDGVSGRVQTLVTIGVGDPLLRLQTPSAAEVTVEIVPAPVERTLHEVPVRVGDGEGTRPAALDPGAVTVGIRGPRKLVDALDAGAVEAFLDVAGLPPGRYNLPVTVESGADVGVTHIDPSRVSVTLR